MGFHDIEFPRDVSYGSRGGPMHNTAVVEVASGAEERVQRWTSPRHRYDVAYGLLKLDDQALGAQRVLAFHRARGGRANSFRYWDPLDYSTNPAQAPHNNETVNATQTDESIGTGDGTTKDFQLVKRYTSGVTIVTRALLKPIFGTVKVAVAGVLKTEGADYTVNYSTGVVTFTAAPTTSQAVTAGCKFNVPVRFEDDELSVAIEEFNRGEVQTGIGLIEDVSNVVVPDDLPRLGSTYQSFAADLALTPQMGEFVRLNPTASGKALLLPQHTAYALGGPHWVLQNISGSNALAVKYAGTTLFTLQVAGDASRRDLAFVYLGLDSGGTKTWIGVGP
jgi:uncharacterized protein (TIGR02217 family)